MRRYLLFLVMLFASMILMMPLSMASPGAFQSKYVQSMMPHKIVVLQASMSKSSALIQIRALQVSQSSYVFANLAKRMSLPAKQRYKHTRIKQPLQQAHRRHDASWFTSRHYRLRLHLRQYIKNKRKTTKRMVIKACIKHKATPDPLRDLKLS